VKFFVKTGIFCVPRWARYGYRGDETPRIVEPQSFEPLRSETDTVGAGNDSVSIPK
jgi:hypothetical protein